MMGFPVMMMGGSGAKPPFMGNLYLWLDATDDSTITLSGADVTHWACKLGTIVFGPSGSPNPPERVSDGVLFASSSTTSIADVEHLYANVAGIVGQLNRSYYAVLDNVAVASGGTIIASQNVLTAGSLHYALIYATTTPGFSVFDRAGFGATNVASIGASFAGGARRLVTVIRKATPSERNQVAVDDSALTASAGGAPGDATRPHAFLGLERIPNGTFPCNPLNATLREVLAYDTELSDTDDAAVRAYLNKKWNIW